MTSLRHALRFIFLPLILLFAFAFLVSSKSQVKAQTESERFIVKYRRGVLSEERHELHRRVNSDIVSSLRKLDVDVARIRSDRVEESIKMLRDDPRVEYVEPDYKAQALLVSNDPFLTTNQWGLFKIQAANASGASAWDLSQGSDSVKVAILDTGIDKTHPDIGEKIVSQINLSDSDTVQDVYGHGTHVAGIVAATTNNATGVAGMGYSIKLANVKVLDDDGSGYYSWIADGITWAADQGIPVINMSLGGSSKSQTLQNAVRYAWDKGVVMVAAAGNGGSSTYSYPAAYQEVISVAATDSSDQKASFSNYGTWVEVAAPGVSIFSTVPTYPNGLGNAQNYGNLSGTSMATPFVSGLAGLILSTSSRTNAEVRTLIDDGADQIKGTGSSWRKGRINAYRSLQKALGLEPSPTPSPLPLPTATPTPSLTPTPKPSPTATPTPTKIPTAPAPPAQPTQPPQPTPKFSNRWSYWCQRFGIFCN